MYSGTPTSHTRFQPKRDSSQDRFSLKWDSFKDGISYLWKLIIRVLQNSKNSLQIWFSTLSLSPTRSLYLSLSLFPFLSLFLSLPLSLSLSLSLLSLFSFGNLTEMKAFSNIVMVKLCLFQWCSTGIVIETGVLTKVNNLFGSEQRIGYLRWVFPSLSI